MSILFASTVRDSGPWVAAFRACDPTVAVQGWPDIGKLQDVTFAVVWKPPAGLLAQLPRLGAVSSLGAGVEGLLADPEIPDHIPLVRVVDGNLADRMAEYVTLHVLRYHRDLDRTRAQQEARDWTWFPSRDTTKTTVGILGFGAMGQRAAASLGGFGFRIRGWTRTPRRVEGAAMFHGRAMLGDFLSGCDYLVCLLPLTPETNGLVDAEALARLPRGAHFINAGRGAQMVDKDVLAALDSGQLAAATLDVFATEPLPADHRFWTHPRVTITPHNAADTQPASVVPQMLDNYRRLQAGEPLRHVVDRARGY